MKICARRRKKYLHLHWSALKILRKIGGNVIKDKIAGYSRRCALSSRRTRGRRFLCSDTRLLSHLHIVVYYMMNLTNDYATSYVSLQVGCGLGVPERTLSEFRAEGEQGAE